MTKEMIFPIRPLSAQSVKIDFGKKRTYKDPKRANYQKQIAKMALFFGSCARIGKVKVWVEFHFIGNHEGYSVNAHHGDCDNLHKPFFDALQGILIENDRFIVTSHIKKVYDETDFVLLHIKHVKEEQFELSLDCDLLDLWRCETTKDIEIFINTHLLIRD